MYTNVSPRIKNFLADLKKNFKKKYKIFKKSFKLTKINYIADLNNHSSIIEDSDAFHAERNFLLWKARVKIGGFVTSFTQNETIDGEEFMWHLDKLCTDILDQKNPEGTTYFYHQKFTSKSELFILNPKIKRFAELILKMIDSCLE
jgi:hypothetical protein